MYKALDNAVLKKAAHYRGAIINGTVVVERLMDVYLACHFADDPHKRDELLDLVFASSPGIPFDIKRNLFIIILKKHNSTFHDENKKLIEDLSFIGKRRNIIAHYLLDRSYGALDVFKDKGDIGFVKFKEVTETIYFSDKDVDDLDKKIRASIVILTTLLPKGIENAPS